LNSARAQSAAMAAATTAARHSVGKKLGVMHPH
jgi:hypothetical protein